MISYPAEFIAILPAVLLATLINNYYTLPPPAVALDVKPSIGQMLATLVCGHQPVGLTAHPPKLAGEAGAGANAPTAAELKPPRDDEETDSEDEPDDSDDEVLDDDVVVVPSPKAAAPKGAPSPGGASGKYEDEDFEDDFEDDDIDDEVLP